ncbi:HK97 gp10 family phage protein [Lysinibacillus sp. RC79]|uniref:HK97 gp10 family phage protein n=1 Tax=Lysinibacillus sp. RC79 TaxID=3156296 RepID=UPI003517D3F2
MIKVSIDELSDTLIKELNTFSREVSEGLDKAKTKIAREGAAELRNTSPKRKKNGGEYAKGWTTVKQGTAAVICNQTKPSLTHLLEKGHANRNGGRTPGKEHIYPVEQSAIEKYEKEVERVIRG